MAMLMMKNTAQSVVKQRFFWDGTFELDRFKLSLKQAWHFFLRELAAGYRESLLGILWNFIPVFVLSLSVFTLYRENAIKGPASTLNPFVHVLVGLSIWQLVVEAMISAIEAVNKAKPIFTKVVTHLEPYLFANFFNVGFSFVFRLLLILVALVFCGQFELSRFASFALLFSGIVISSFFLGVFIIPFHVLFKDISKVLPYIFSAGFLITPIAFNIPDSGFLSLAMRLNPATYAIEGGRAILGEGEVSWVGVVIVLIMSLVMPIISLFFLNIIKPFITERLS